MSVVALKSDPSDIIVPGNVHTCDHHLFVQMSIFVRCELIVFFVHCVTLKFTRGKKKKTEKSLFAFLFPLENK